MQMNMNQKSQIHTSVYINTDLVARMHTHKYTHLAVGKSNNCNYIKQKMDHSSSFTRSL